LISQLKLLSERFLKSTENKKVNVITHHDTDGISSAAILIKTLQKLDRKFSIRIIKQLEKEMIDELIKEDEVNIFLDLGSSNIEELEKVKGEVFIIDHHQIDKEKVGNTNIINPMLTGDPDISGSSLTYLFAKEINKENTNLAKLAIIGMIGDMLEKNINHFTNQIIKDAKEVIVKKGLSFFSATRPLHKALEFSNIYINGVTGKENGAIKFLNEIGIEWKTNGSYRTPLDLDEDENSKLITSLLLRVSNDNGDNERLISNLYLIKFLNKMEDARELSTLINACSRLGHSEVALALCLETKRAKEKAETIYAEYKQNLVHALNTIENIDKIEGKNYVIINARDEIKDTIIGTVASMLSNSPKYTPETIIITMAYSEDKVKVSGRIKYGRNIAEILSRVIAELGGECGGHPNAAGCLISKNQEYDFIEKLKKELEIEVVKL